MSAIYLVNKDYYYYASDHLAAGYSASRQRHLNRSMQCGSVDEPRCSLSPSLISDRLS